jgi:hypothetical protein
LRAEAGAADVIANTAAIASIAPIILKILRMICSFYSGWV